MAKVKFKVGDRVRLRDYSEFTDYKRHAGEVARVISLTPSRFDLKIRWESGAESNVRSDNCELVTKGEEVKPYQRKTFKQLKDSVTVKKGALWQEACDDGDQEYVLLDSAFNRDPRQTQRIYDRALVEDDPKNFVEVFKVSPEYQTREELDLWEAFQKSQAKVRVTKPVAKRVARKTKKAA